MKKNIVYLILLISVISIICVLFNEFGSNKSSETINNIDYNILEFQPINISKSKLNRYNELVNIPQVSFFVRNLSMVLANDKLNEESVIVYTYNYAVNFKNNSNKYVVNDSGSAYIDCDYTESLVYELFGRNIDLDKYKQQNGYLLIRGDNLKTDTIQINITDILYNEDFGIYKIIIREYDHNIEIVYKYKDGKYTLLSCLEGMNRE